MNNFQVLKLLFVLFLVLFMYQCEDAVNDPELNDSESVTLLKGGKGGSGGGGNGGGGGAKDYGDLVVCLRDADGIPIYELIEGEYYPLPIKFDSLYEEPVTEGSSYATFELETEGEDAGDIILEPGFFVKEADFGRLSLVRAPQTVLDAALAEAIVGLTQNGVWNITTDASGRLVAIIGAEDWLVNFDADTTNDEDNDKTIDSPRENMAIYQELMSYGLSRDLDFLLNDGYFTDADVIDLAIGAVAAGADKTGNIGVDEIAYMNDWIIFWDELSDEIGPDAKNRKYFNFEGFGYIRSSTYATKYVEITTLYSDGSWKTEPHSLLSVVPWTNSNKLIDYAEGGNTKITGFANAADDAIQVLEFIHDSDLIVYSPYFQ
jgi:hypothetical protein